jgi:hypothetical protein
MTAIITHVDKEQMERLFEVKWAEFLDSMGTPHFRPSVELKDMAINLALHATKLEREAQIAIWTRIVEEERAACWKIADEEAAAMNGVFIESAGNRGIRALAARESAARIRERIRARGGK